ncbi:hypothetical protein FB470_001925 [Amycolatopsis thermophila]|uniref:Uncharacterized protein n=1 Tax=Amycolatopsis thermophila TaxID=206084 RepID=A0ABU0ESF8_9PSEU|nr:hypothetical protein [Amycolatopsis thermophila]
MAVTHPPQSVIPMGGVECGRCGQPALEVQVFPKQRFVIHLDPRVTPCPVPNPEVRSGA